jgi:hypothetical protein
MKRYYIFLWLIVIFSSCENALDEQPKSFISKTNYYKDEADAEGAILGAYSIMSPDYYEITYYLMEVLHADYLNGRGSQATISNFDHVLDATNIARASTNWSKIYIGINRANAVLNNVPKIEKITEATRTRILAEAHYLRGSAYFNLVRNWGAVPIKTEESVDLSSVASPREPVEKVYELIISDAIAAEKDLPESVGGETGKASKWAAKMLLAQVYLTLEQWSLAAEKSNDIIKSGRYSLVNVSQPDDFYKIFAVETSSEDIMSVHHSATMGSGLPGYIHRSNTYPYNYGSGVYAWLPDTNSFIGSSWDNKDLRKDFNLYRTYKNDKGETVSLPPSTPVLFKKFITNSAGLTLYSVPIYRYAETLLMYAEASCMAEDGPSELALERLNMVKRRAYGYNPNFISPVDYPSGLSRDAFRDIVLKERGYEFIIERQRWWDLKRTGRVKDAFAAVGKTFIDERYLWPIPQNEINNNPALTPKDQNPGY